MDQEEERREVVRKAKWLAATGALVRHCDAPLDHGTHPDIDRLLHVAFANGVEDHPLAIRERARRLVFKFDHDYLSELAGFDLSEMALAELATATAGWTLRFHASYDRNGVLTQQEWTNILDQPRGVERDVRRSYIREVLDIWLRYGPRPCAGAGPDAEIVGVDLGRPSRSTLRYYGETYQVPASPVVKLIVALLRVLPEVDQVEEFTIHHDLDFLIAGTDRHALTTREE